MANTRVTSRIGRGIYMAKSASHQYYVAGNRRDGWTVNTNEHTNGLPKSETRTQLATGVSFFNAEQAIINHWAKATSTVPPRQEA